MPQIKSAKKRMRQNEKRAKRNRQIKNRTKNSIKEFIGIAEALHDKKIMEIADQITKKHEELCVICIAGPSSSFNRSEKS